MERGVDESWPGSKGSPRCNLPKIHENEYRNEASQGLLDEMEKDSPFKSMITGMTKTFPAHDGWNASK